jgi:predicted permease
MSVAETWRASLSAVGTAAALAGTGVYLHRRGMVPTEARHVLGRYSQQVGLPCLFFTKVVHIRSSETFHSSRDSSNRTGWILLLWPVYVVSCGLLVGYGLSLVARVSPSQRTSLLVATAFANSTGLPMTLLSMLSLDLSTTSTTTTSTTAVIDPTVYLSVYLILYPILQWGIGGTLLGLGQETVGPATTQSNVSSRLSSRTSWDEDDTEDAHENDMDGDLEITPLHNPTRVGLAPSGESSSSLSKERGPLDARGGAGPSWQTFGQAARRAISQPPVVGALSGWLVASCPPLQHLWTEGALQWLGQAVATVGQAAIPVNMAVLGVNLSLTSWSNWRDMEDKNLLVAAVIGKLIVMPLIGLVSVLLLSTFYPSVVDASMVMVLALVFCTPTANNVMVMTDLSPALEASAKQAMARILACQYLFVPVLLSLWVMLALRLAQGVA